MLVLLILLHLDLVGPSLSTLLHAAPFGGLLDGMMALSDLLGAAGEEPDGEGAEVGILGWIRVEDHRNDVAGSVVDLLGAELVLEDEPGRVKK